MNDQTAPTQVHRLVFEKISCIRHLQQTILDLQRQVTQLAHQHVKELPCLQLEQPPVQEETCRSHRSGSLSNVVSSLKRQLSLSEGRRKSNQDHLLFHTPNVSPVMAATSVPVEDSMPLSTSAPALSLLSKAFKARITPSKPLKVQIPLQTPNFDFVDEVKSAPIEAQSHRRWTHFLGLTGRDMSQRTQSAPLPTLVERETCQVQMTRESLLQHIASTLWLHPEYFIPLLEHVSQHEQWVQWIANYFAIPAPFVSSSGSLLDASYWQWAKFCSNLLKTNLEMKWKEVFLKSLFQSDAMMPFWKKIFVPLLDASIRSDPVYAQLFKQLLRQYLFMFPNWCLWLLKEASIICFRVFALTANEFCQNVERLGWIDLVLTDEHLKNLANFGRLIENATYPVNDLELFDVTIPEVTVFPNSITLSNAMLQELIKASELVLLERPASIDQKSFYSRILDLSVDRNSVIFWIQLEKEKHFERMNLDPISFFNGTVQPLVRVLQRHSLPFNVIETLDWSHYFTLLDEDFDEALVSDLNLEWTADFERLTTKIKEQEKLIDFWLNSIKINEWKRDQESLLLKQSQCRTWLRLRQSKLDCFQSAFSNAHPKSRSKLLRELLNDLHCDPDRFCCHCDENYPRPDCLLTRMVYSLLYKTLFFVDGAKVVREDLLLEKKMLRSVQDPHFALPAHLTRLSLNRLVHALQRLDVYLSPFDKLQYLSQSLQSLDLCADDLLPCFIHALVKARPRYCILTMNYFEEATHVFPELSSGLLAYGAVQWTAAVSFVRQM